MARKQVVFPAPDGPKAPSPSPRNDQVHVQDEPAAVERKRRRIGEIRPEEPEPSGGRSF